MSGCHNCLFKSEKIVITEFKDWFQEVKDQPYYVFCWLCRKSLDVRNMGISALRSCKKAQSYLKVAGIDAKEDEGGSLGYITYPRWKPKQCWLQVHLHLLKVIVIWSRNSDTGQVGARYLGICCCYWSFGQFQDCFEKVDQKKKFVGCYWFLFGMSWLCGPTFKAS